MYDITINISHQSSKNYLQILEMDLVNAYLKDSPFTAKQSPENEIAYERLMDVRLKLVDLSFEIDKYHDSYMRFLTQTLNSPDLKNRIGKVTILIFHNSYIL